MFFITSGMILSYYGFGILLISFYFLISRAWIRSSPDHNCCDLPHFGCFLCSQSAGYWSGPRLPFHNGNHGFLFVLTFRLIFSLDTSILPLTTMMLIGQHLIVSWFCAWLGLLLMSMMDLKSRLLRMRLKMSPLFFRCWATPFFMEEWPWDLSFPLHFSTSLSWELLLLRPLESLLLASLVFFLDLSM